MNRLLKNRRILNGLMIFSIVFLPWWVSLIVGLLLLVYHKAPELVVWTLIFDLLYGFGTVFPLFIPFILTALSILLFVGVEYFKQRLVFYQ